MNPDVTCSCLSCVVTYTDMNTVIHLADCQFCCRNHQDYATRNAKVISHALTSNLWYSRILEAHLNTTVKVIKLFGSPPGMVLYQMNDVDVESGTDHFLDRSVVCPEYQAVLPTSRYHYLSVYWQCFPSSINLALLSYH